MGYHLAAVGAAFVFFSKLLCCALPDTIHTDIWSRFGRVDRGFAVVGVETRTVERLASAAALKQAFTG
jgi:hypothetical protein